MTKPLLFAGPCLLVLTSMSFADEVPKAIVDPVRKVEARFEPAEAKPGQNVTLKIELQMVDGWTTYPTKQPDPNAKLFVNKIMFPDDGTLTFTGKIKEPANPKILDSPLDEIKELHTHAGGIWECEVKVMANALPGRHSVKIGFRVESMDQNGRCKPPKRYDLEAVIKISGEPTPEKRNPEPPEPPKKPEVLKNSLTDKQRIVWMLTLPAAVGSR